MMESRGTLRALWPSAFYVVMMIDEKSAAKRKLRAQADAKTQKATFTKRHYVVKDKA
jgi:hypothetical protein